MTEELQNLIHLLTQMCNETDEGRRVADASRDAYREGLRRALILAMNPGIVNLALTVPTSKYFIKAS